MKRIIYLTAIGCFLVFMQMGCGGGGGGEDPNGNDISPKAADVAKEIAEERIAAEYPGFIGISPIYERYESQGRSIHSFTYMRTLEYENGGAVIQIPSNVVVNVDQDTGETEIFLSN